MYKVQEKGPALYRQQEPPDDLGKRFSLEGEHPASS